MDQILEHKALIGYVKSDYIAGTTTDYGIKRLWMRTKIKEDGHAVTTFEVETQKKHRKPIGTPYNNLLVAIDAYNNV